jgi:predicted RND superfamily exporter protein
MSKITHFFHTLELALFKHPKAILSVVGLVTLFFASQIPALKMYSDFSDLLPQSHPYIQLHNSIKDKFGGANVIVVGIVAERGDIFNNEALRMIHEVTQAVDELPGVNHNLLSSFTHRTVRKTWLTEMGNIVSEPYYKPLDPALTDDQLAQLKKDVVANPQVYGPLVSPDMRMALIKAQLNEGQLDYEDTFAKLQELRHSFEGKGYKVYATGQPVLVGWAYFYKDQIFQILAFTALIMVGLLIFHFRTMLGVMVPLAGVLVSTVWGLGIISLFGYNIDPLGLVIPFLISARAMSHGIQLVERFYAELPESGDNQVAARTTFESLFRPGSLGVVSDAIGLLLIAIGSIPLNTKLANYASVWAMCIIITVLISVPLLLSILPKPRKTELHQNSLRVIGNVSAAMVVGRPGAVIILMAIALVGGAFLASHVTIGESEPGSPVLYQDHDYNISSKTINDSFPGSEELYIVAETDEEGGIKRPEVLAALASLEAHMLLDPEVGGAKGVPDLIMMVNRLLHNNDPKWMQIPKDDAYVGGLLFAYMASSPIPGAADEFLDPHAKVANLVFYYKDHQGETIRRAIHTAKQWIAENDGKVEGLHIRLAGGTIGVTAAMNEAAFETNKQVLPLVFLFIFLSVMVFYGSWHAGFLMFLAMLFATTLTYAYMGITEVGININTVPIIAVGVGVGIDYSIYMMDRIREQRTKMASLSEAVKSALSSTGLAISFTALTLIAGIVMWIFMSDLRFQADAALLLSVMVILNALAALFLIPAWVLVFKPKFVDQLEVDEDGVIHAKG